MVLPSFSIRSCMLRIVSDDHSLDWEIQTSLSHIKQFSYSISFTWSFSEGELEQPVRRRTPDKPKIASFISWGYANLRSLIWVKRVFSGTKRPRRVGGGYRHGKSRSNLLAMANNDKLSRGTLIGFIGGLIGVALTASSGNEQLIAGAFVVGCILGVIFGTVESDWK